MKKQYCGSYNEGICKDERYLDKPCPFINDHNWSVCEYWVSSKRVNVKGHYRVIKRDAQGRIISSKKWSSKSGGEKMGKKIVKQDSVNYSLRKGRRVILKANKPKSIMFPNGEPEYWYAEYGVEEDKLIVRLGDFIIMIPREKVESWFEIRKHGGTKA